MDFKPLIPRDPVADGPAHLRGRADGIARPAAGVPLSSASPTTGDQIIFFVNLERFALRRRGRHRGNRQDRRTRSRSLGKRSTPSSTTTISLIVPELLDDYSGHGPRADGKYYSEVTRYTTSGFLRMKLGDALKKRGVAPHIYESAAEARKDWREETK